MRRDEACWLLTKIAQSEIIGSHIAQRMYQIRDRIVCEPNKRNFAIDDEKPEEDITCQFLTLVSDDALISDEVQCDLLELVRCIKGNRFVDCEEMVYWDRCHNCPAFKGERK